MDPNQTDNSTDKPAMGSMGGQMPAPSPVAPTGGSPVTPTSTGPTIPAASGPTTPTDTGSTMSSGGSMNEPTKPAMGGGATEPVIPGPTDKPDMPSEDKSDEGGDTGGTTGPSTI